MSTESKGVAARLLAPSRWRAWEVVVWLLIWAAPLAMPQHAALINEIAIFALFAMSLDLVLGYAGIVSLGQAAFFGAGAYAAGLLAKQGMGDPLLGLAASTLLGALLGALTSPMIVRGTDLTRLMVTMGVALVLYELANKYSEITGGADGLQGVVMRRSWASSSSTLALAWPRSIRWPSCLSPSWCCAASSTRSSASRCRHCATTACVRRRSASSVNGRLALVYTLGAALAGAAGALAAQTTGFASLDGLEFHRSADVMVALVIGGAGWLWGGLVGAIAFKVLHDLISTLTPQYWTFWIGLFLVVLMLVGRERLLRPRQWLKRGRS